MRDIKGMGREGLVDRHGLLTDDAKRRAADILDQVAAEGIEAIRLSFADQHGILRGKTVVADELAGAFAGGCSMTTTLLLKDTSHRTVFPVWAEGDILGRGDIKGAGDFIMVPDPATFRVLPWADGTGWMLCDLYFPDGTPVPFSTRQIARDAMGTLHDAGFDYLSGLEVEFHILQLDDPKLTPGQAGQPADPPDVSLLTHGFQYLTEFRMDEAEEVLSTLRAQVMDLGLPVRTVEVEFGPSQFEFTFRPEDGIGSADTMVLFRSAVKQICRRMGLHATFMCRPAVKDLFSSGWHLHQSLWNTKTGDNAFMPSNDGVLSETGLAFIAGLLEHAPAACAFSNPTINGYKRFRPFTLAPDRILWGIDNKGAMLRALGGNGDPATRIENRVGEPSANPYLYLASQVYAGLDGIKRGLTPATPADAPYSTEAPRLPASLMESLNALRGNALYRDVLGDQFVDYFLTIKDAEVARFLSEVTDWEQREYFEIF